WLRMFRPSFHGLTRHVIVHGRSSTGFPYYQEIIDKVQALPDVAVAVPTLKTYGLININNSIRDGVQVIGYPIDRIGLVNRFPDSLYRQHQKALEEGKKPGTQPSFALLPDIPYNVLRPNVKGGADRWPGMIVGAGVINIHKDKDGKLERP